MRLPGGFLAGKVGVVVVGLVLSEFLSVVQLKKSEEGKTGRFVFVIDVVGDQLIQLAQLAFYRRRYERGK